MKSYVIRAVGDYCSHRRAAARCGRRAGGEEGGREKEEEQGSKTELILLRFFAFAPFFIYYIYMNTIYFPFRISLRIPHS